MPKTRLLFNPLYAIPILAIPLLACSSISQQQSMSFKNIDWRNIRIGDTIPDQGYCDQPYVVITQDGHWLCTLTTGKGKEGDPGQHVVATISADQGKTWSELIDIEPETGQEASWVIPLIVPSGRVYVFYDYNGDRISDRRADMLGWYVFKYSDDHGRTWSNERYRLPVRRTACDANNGFEDGTQIFWGIDKPMIHDGSVYFAFTKLGKYMLDLGEGWIFRSDNLLTESDPTRIEWQMLPDGEHGIRHPDFGSVQEEHNIVALEDGSLYCMYRTTTGHPGSSLSRDGGHTWSQPEFATYTPGGQPFKHNRACPAIWKTQNGNYLFWFNNHSEKSYENRNPIWISGGKEKEGTIYWSQPEILLYDPDRNVRISYPDLIEDNGRFWISQTQKSIARINEIDPTLLEGLWSQDNLQNVTKEGMIFERKENFKETVNMPQLPNLQEGGGFSLDCWIIFNSLDPGQILLDSRDETGKGILLQTSVDSSIQTTLNDGITEYSWASDSHRLTTNQWHHIAIIVDGGPKVLSYVIDGILCDGGEQRTQGWGRIPNELSDLNSAKTMNLAPNLKGKIEVLRIYDRYLRTSEAIGNFHAGF